ncbi:MAG: Gfo/Idh/MocA family oxidoreductase [bacterium]|nr:Gfo/Idh/MocA family oxidoreductase [bacterium]
MFNLALVGTGRWGKNYIKTIEPLKNCQLPDKYQKNRDYEDLFKYKEIDGIIIATPASTHFKIARDCLKRGYNLLIEKPLTTSYKEAQELWKIYKRQEVVVLIGHLQLYDPAYSKIRQVLKKVGKLKRLTYQGLQSPVRGDTTLLWDWGPHPISLFLDLIGKEPLSVSAKNSSEDTVHIDFKFPGQISAEIDIGWTAPERRRYLSIEGTNGLLVLDSSSETKKLYFVDTKTSRKQALDFPTRHLPLELEISEFVRCIKSGKEPRTSLRQGVQVVKIIDSLPT